MRECLTHCIDRYRIRMVNKLQLVVSHQGKSCKPEKGVKNISLIARSVGKTTSSAVFFQVLAVEDILSQFVQVNQILALYHIA